MAGDLTWLPVAALVAAGGFLGAGTAFGLKRGLKRAALAAETQARAAAAGSSTASAATVAVAAAPAQPLAAPAVEQLSTRQAMNVRLPGAAGMTAGELAVKALLYGTALCLGGSAVAVVGVGLALDVRDLEGFARKMEVLLPAWRERMEGAMAPSLRSLSDTAASTAVPAIRDSVGRAIGSSVPAIAPKGGSGPGGAVDELAGLSKKERAVLLEWAQWLESALEGKADAAAAGAAAATAGPATAGAPTARPEAPTAAAS